MARGSGPHLATGPTRCALVDRSATSSLFWKEEYLAAGNRIVLPNMRRGVFISISACHNTEHSKATSARRVKWKRLTRGSAAPRQPVRAFAACVWLTVFDNADKNSRSMGDCND